MVRGGGQLRRGSQAPSVRFFSPRRGPEGAHLGGGHGRCSSSQARLQSWPHGADSPDGLSCGPGSLPRHPRVSRGPLGPSWGWGALHLGGGLAHAGTEGSRGQARPEEGRNRAGMEEVFGPSGVSTAAKDGGSPCRLRQTSACPMGSGWVGSDALREHRGGGQSPLAAPQRPRSQRPAAGQSQGSWKPRGHGRPAPHPQQEAGLGRAGFAHDAETGTAAQTPCPQGRGTGGGRRRLLRRLAGLPAACLSASLALTCPTLRAPAPDGAPRPRAALGTPPRCADSSRLFRAALHRQAPHSPSHWGLEPGTYVPPAWGPRPGPAPPACPQ